MKWKLLLDFQLQNFGGADLFRGNLNKNDRTRLRLKFCNYGQNFDEL